MNILVPRVEVAFYIVLIVHADCRISCAKNHVYFLHQELHKAALRKGLDAGGDVSLQNGLDMAVEALQAVPPYGSREVLLVFAGLSTCDPGDLLGSVQAAKAAKCRVSILGVAAEVYICKHMAKVLVV